MGIVYLVPWPYPWAHLPAGRLWEGVASCNPSFNELVSGWTSAMKPANVGQ